jgi:hypothetical protein
MGLGELHAVLLRKLMVDYRARAWWNPVMSVAPIANCALQKS